MPRLFSHTLGGMDYDFTLSQFLQLYLVEDFCIDLFLFDQVKCNFIINGEKTPVSKRHMRKVENVRRDMILYETHPILYTNRNLMGAPEKH